MGQPSFFDLNRRYEGLVEKCDPLWPRSAETAPVHTLCKVPGPRTSVFDGLRRR
jgi:hypothetical protein